ncbi:NAD(P)-binding protein [Rhodococcus sp. HNM0563]|uniref:FAD-dependent monooxygenase n=1 Tax=unclassified Rhodococcus (in: high G+C Gram-positive bacteria) TaxID=192944 RepID=UPI00146DB197|nr:FAD-dependent monooxygenase [Rhodococcus sp. F64268]MCK0092582.1 FAD-dependent monooxygenase [Rhodococcus sp. F64268]NLU64348.1 NAD(P)-binding protein [Rhodococcus sp. HNM0563]
MSEVSETSVLVVGAGPVGLTAAIELRRRGVSVVVIDKLKTPTHYAKAVGIQPRTLEVWDAMGVARPALDLSTPMHGQIVFVNGDEAMRVDLELPDDVPYRFTCMPQYATEEVLRRALAERGTKVRYGVELTGFEQSSRGVVAALRSTDGTEHLSARYLVGCDGAHSATRKGLGSSFEGDAFPEEYMLADVELDWSLPSGYAVRAMTQENGSTSDLMVCIPLPGDQRYRVSSLVAPDLATTRGDGAVAHGLEGKNPPTLAHIQAVLDRLAPEPTRARNMRWSSVFRISHRIVDSYGAGRVFLAGDAAHIHPPTGAQGMNTGIQDAYNLGWKLALAVSGNAADGLLASYDVERRPIGEDVVGRTVRHAREGIGSGETDVETIILREAQLLLNYRNSPIVGGSTDGGGPVPGNRAPDARELRQDALAAPLRLHDLLRHPGHTVLLWAPTGPAVKESADLAEGIADRFGGLVRGYVLTPDLAQAADGRVLRDERGNAARMYGFGAHPEIVVVRPDGYVGFRGPGASMTTLVAHLANVLHIAE